MKRTNPITITITARTPQEAKRKAEDTISTADALFKTVNQLRRQTPGHALQLEINR